MLGINGLLWLVGFFFLSQWKCVLIWVLISHPTCLVTEKEKEKDG